MSTLTACPPSMTIPGVRDASSTEARSTHGDLLAIARQHISAAHTTITAPEPHTRAGAFEEISAYRELLNALRTHAQRLFGPRRRADAVRQALDPDPAQAACLRLLDTLSAVAARRANAERRVTPQRCPSNGPGAYWLGAARAIRAASDLLATHRDPVRAWRTPDSHHLDDPGVRVAGLHRIAALLTAVADDEAALRARARRARVSWLHTTRTLPDLTAARATAGTILRSPCDPHDVAWLDGVHVAKPLVRTGNPAIELADRLDRLRQLAWELAAEPDPSIATLTDLAMVAATIHSRAAAAPLPGHGNLFERRAAAWRRVHRGLNRVSSLAPADPQVRDEARAVLGLLSDMVPAGDGDCDGDREESAALACLSARRAATWTHIASWNLITLQRLLRSNLVWLPADRLTGDQVSDDPHLVTAKLRHAHIPAQPDHVESLLHAYRRVAAAEGP